MALPPKRKRGKEKKAPALESSSNPLVTGEGRRGRGKGEKSYRSVRRHWGGRKEKKKGLWQSEARFPASIVRNRSSLKAGS